jgi:hypothetical protein
VSAAWHPSRDPLAEGNGPGRRARHGEPGAGASDRGRAELAGGRGDDRDGGPGANGRAFSGRLTRGPVQSRFGSQARRAMPLSNRRDFGRSFDLIRDAEDVRRRSTQASQAFERQVVISQALDAYCPCPPPGTVGRPLARWIRGTRVVVWTSRFKLRPTPLLLFRRFASRRYACALRPSSAALFRWSAAALPPAVWVTRSSISSSSSHTGSSARSM